MNVVRLFNPTIIELTIKNPKIYRWLKDDNTPESWKPLLTNDHYYLGVYDDDNEYLGLFLFIPLTSILYEIHTCLLPEAWGKNSVKAAHEALEWMFINTGCKRVTTRVPEDNKLARRFTERVGGEYVGFEPESWLKNNELIGQHIYSLGYKKFWRDIKCQQQD